jgi:hypothetical protein
LSGIDALYGILENQVCCGNRMSDKMARETGVECDWRTELIPASEDADEFAAVAEDKDEFLCNCVRHIL